MCLEYETKIGRKMALYKNKREITTSTMTIFGDV